MWTSGARTRSALLALLALAVAVAAGCDQPTCLRNSDCPLASTCSPAGVCEGGAPDAGPDADDASPEDAALDAADDAALDAADDAALDAADDAALDAAVDAPNPPITEPFPDRPPPIVTAYDAGTDAPPPVDPTLALPDLTGPGTVTQ